MVLMTCPNSLLLLSGMCRYVPVVGVSIVPTLSSQVSRLAPDLETLDDWIGRREVTIVSLILNTSLLLDSGVLELAVVFSAA